MKRTFYWLALVGLLTLLPRADVAADDKITLTHEQMGKLMQRYHDALVNQAKALDALDKLRAEDAKIRDRMDICWAGYGGFKN